MTKTKCDFIQKTITKIKSKFACKIDTGTHAHTDTFDFSWPFRTMEYCFVHLTTYTLLYLVDPCIYTPNLFEERKIYKLVT